MIIIKIDCCGHPQTLCGLSIWMSSDVMQVKGLSRTTPGIQQTTLSLSGIPQTGFSRGNLYYLPPKGNVGPKPL